MNVSVDRRKWISKVIYMRERRPWSVMRILRVVGLWFLLWLLVTGLWGFYQLRLSPEAGGSAGIGAVSIGISEAFVEFLLAAILVVPVILLARRWRRRHHG